MRLPLRAFLTGLLCLCAGGTAWAQFDQYTTPGGPAGRPEDAKGRLAREVAAARYHLGPVRVAPTLGLQDLAYVKSLLASGQAAPTDVTATVAGGVRLYLPTGPKVTWTGYVLPEYVWWRTETERRRLNDRLGVGFHAFWNQLTVEVSGGRDEAQRILTPELPRLADARVDHAELVAELVLSSRFSLFSRDTALVQKSLASADDPQSSLFDVLDRREEVERVGVHWRPIEGWVLGLGAEHSKVSFLDRRPGEPDRSNAGTAPVVEAVFNHDRLFMNVDLAARSLTATEGSDFVRYHKVTGMTTFAYHTEAGPEVFVYGRRDLIYSLLFAYPYLDEERVGTSLHVRLGNRARGSLYLEGGSDGYTASVPGAPSRSDAVLSYGGSVELDLGRSASLVLSGVKSRYNSNIPGADRSFTSLGITVTLTGKPAS
jgi:hypothetical protein